MALTSNVIDRFWELILEQVLFYLGPVVTQILEPHFLPGHLTPTLFRK